MLDKKPETPFFFLKGSHFAFSPLFIAVGSVTGGFVSDVAPHCVCRAFSPLFIAVGSVTEPVRIVYPRAQHVSFSPLFIAVGSVTAEFKATCHRPHL